MKLKIVIALIVLLALTSCSHSASNESDEQPIQNTNDIESVESEEPIQFTYTECSLNDEDYVIIDGYGPPIKKSTFDQPCPDFLTEEQQNLYRCAKELYYILTARPADIQFPSPGSPDSSRSTSTKVYFCTSDGFSGDFYAVRDRYESWDDFVEMGNSVFTEDYFRELYSVMFLSLDGHTCYREQTCSPDLYNTPYYSVYYNWNDTPDTFALISQSDAEIVFEVTGYLYTSADRQNEAEVHLPVKMILTDNGWRVSLFNSAENSELPPREEDTANDIPEIESGYQKAVSKILETEFLVLLYTYEGENYSVFYGYQSAAMSHGYRFWIVSKDGDTKDIRNEFDYKFYMYLGDFGFNADQTILYCTDTCADLYKDLYEDDEYKVFSVKYSIDLASGTIIEKVVQAAKVVYSEKIDN